MTPWIEAMRLRTLPVGLSGVIAALAYAAATAPLKVLPAVLCLLFALLAQVASNFANEYFDYRSGRDAPGRSGPRRGVTEGDITPRAMLRATMLTLGAACAIGLCLIYWGGWWLLAAGALIAVGVVAYSAGPFPLASNCLGEVAVVLFYGIVPVNLTFYLQTLHWNMAVFYLSLTIGLMGANVLIVNNYRDIEPDRLVRKHTLPSVLGRRPTAYLYLASGWVAIALSTPLWSALGRAWWLVPVGYALCHTLLWYRLSSPRLGQQAATAPAGRSPLNPLLGATSMLMFLYALSLVFALNA